MLRRKTAAAAAAKTAKPTAVIAAAKPAARKRKVGKGKGPAARPDHAAPSPAEAAAGRSAHQRKLETTVFGASELDETPIIGVASEVSHCARCPRTPRPPAVLRARRWGGLAGEHSHTWAVELLCKIKIFATAPPSSPPNIATAPPSPATVRTALREEPEAVRVKVSGGKTVGGGMEANPGCYQKLRSRDLALAST